MRPQGTSASGTSAPPARRSRPWANIGAGFQRRRPARAPGEAMGQHRGRLPAPAPRPRAGRGYPVGVATCVGGGAPPARRARPWANIGAGFQRQLPARAPGEVGAASPRPPCCPAPHSRAGRGHGPTSGPASSASSPPARRARCGYRLLDDECARRPARAPGEVGAASPRPPCCPAPHSRAGRGHGPTSGPASSASSPPARRARPPFQFCVGFGAQLPARAPGEALIGSPLLMLITAPRPRAGRGAPAAGGLMPTSSAPLARRARLRANIEARFQRQLPARAPGEVLRRQVV